ncbi:C-type lectin domain family 1 member B-like [Gymnodraco acuticeps]|uniref:C-type lectin domain family 1 member B-like n=1 Tax=Gymnodraco acuticeps TaxID=8218 RepID=A0A6P8V3Y8_GYMAC|nr:C-type lectin domain family 1 member B-like [Gymnodraco acuticeps]
MEEITGEADYVNAPEGPADKKATRPDDTKKGSAPEGTVDTKASPPGLRFVLPIAVCWIILLAIMGLRIYLTSELSEDNAKQTAEILKLTSQKDGLTKQIQEMETNWNELNVSRAQWSINEYCKLGDVTQCRPCEMNWGYHEPSCYSINNVVPTKRLTWEEAREYCRALNADLAAAHNEREKNILLDYSLWSLGTNGHWIGLRVENGKWKWADGSDLTNSSWVDPPTEGHCALSVSVWFRTTWLSVSCDQKQQWICQKKALSV